MPVTATMRTACLSIALLSATLSHAQTPTLTSQQTRRLVDAGKLWGYIKYFHPYLQYKSINWDSAFAAAVPAIIDATDRTSYAAALQQWLGILQDPVTRVMPPRLAGEQYSTEHPSPAVVTKDSILYVTIRNLKDLDNWPQAIGILQEIPRQLSQARYLVFDLRPAQPFAWADVDLLLRYSDVEAGLFSGTVYKPTTRSVAHDGFVPESGGIFGGYHSFFKVDQVQSFTGTQKDPVPIAFLLNEYVAVPPIAIALQDAGKAIIISEGPLNMNLRHLSDRYTITEDITISLRTRELVCYNGEATVIPNAVLDKQQDLQINLAKTVALLKAGIPPSTSQHEAPPLVRIAGQAGYTNDQRYPSIGYRVLAAAKIYTVINTFFVNKKLMDRNWEEVYEEYLPRFAAAKDSMEYALAVAAMYAHIQDGHGFISAETDISKRFTGEGVSPSIFGKVIENKFVITAILADSAAQREGLAAGDIILRLDGKDILQLIDEQRPYKPASNKVTQTHYISDNILLGNDRSTATLQVMDKNNQVKKVVITRRRAYNKFYWEKKRPENAGPVFRLLSREIGYVDMQRLENDMVDSMLITFKNTKGFIMDMRGYPQGTAWTLGPRLSQQQAPEAALFTRLQPSSPPIPSDGNDLSFATTTVTFMQKLPATNQWRYTGKTVMLMNETTQSQAEHSGLFYKAANGTTFIGSQTAGANGDVTNFNIPGFINLTFSGQNVSHPNGQTMQRKGLVPDITVEPTIKGIRAGKDEVLDRAVLFLKTGK